MSRPLQLFLLLVVVHAAQLVWYGPRLPAVVASHFNVAGEPDAWMSRAAFLGVLGGLSAFYLALFVGIAALVRRAPAALVNLPHRDYWLAPERAAASREAIVAEMYAIAAATQALTLVLTQLTFAVALGHRETLGGAAWWALALYLAVVLWRLVALWRRFQLPPEAAARERIEPS
jgi:uncharacterized membrane protein